ARCDGRRYGGDEPESELRAISDCRGPRDVNRSIHGSDAVRNIIVVHPGFVWIARSASLLLATEKDMRCISIDIRRRAVRGYPRCDGGGPTNGRRSGGPGRCTRPGLGGGPGCFGGIR